MEIRQLKHFIAIVETGSFTRGAEKVHISQPSISSSISKLEDELGVTLFTRGRKQALLTVQGEKFKISAQRILKEYGAVKTSFQENTEAIHLKLCVASNYPLPKLSSLLADFTELVPDLSFSITDTAPDKMLSAVGKAEFDMAFGITYENERLPQGARALILGEESYGVAVPFDNHLAQRDSISLMELIDEPVIEIRRWEYRNVVIQRLKDENIKLNVKHRVDQYSRALSLVKSGLGITVTASGLIEEGVKFIPFNESGMRRRLTLFVSPSAESFIRDNLSSCIKGS
ncbi:LysR family transcriptional regulator [Neptuniibacter caesariensis]|uniref:LysR family transcriptional regulatory protein n=1 Tax=Neptuniibacter caesariensis TaxID=207954 RepID=A0A7U8C5W8_NEPCE|nr:LysR family transcriptional regulator [Neptuniibacter caesariensis]EAR62148.1 LysR family transcriptional regulatory protein [Oceanospirillum sp. MED92] [Neptuniibacter caesariensis]